MERRLSRVSTPLMIVAIGMFSLLVVSGIAEALEYVRVDCWDGSVIEAWGFACTSKEEPGGWVQCDGVYTFCPYTPVLTVDCSVASYQKCDEWTCYDLAAFATGGTGEYSFRWYSATPVSPSFVNPNLAFKAVLGVPEDVFVVVTSVDQTAGCGLRLFPR